ncbi:unnamed protein product (macronuclear) [Paramecium tetraurelia]|uniref:Protein kinase domain-containing protein n=1 Tax=Paramecium tetraurelia TaxID=5888 RepID=A0DW17_PARTE|nr:uncharacterized protein GSPATT00020887001 [Paramecium tetraurelia]CAK87234.1 unnamed protein product [Paramecium tetraurelia]|eukprot:XP_001454631.1 hypothetical protein (macronuclear) [Paramecium tetraurelia strain d4-2]
MLQQSDKDFTLEQVVGTGTFGMVYLATDNRTKEKVAIKKVYQDPPYHSRIESSLCSNVETLLLHARGKSIRCVPKSSYGICTRDTFKNDQTNAQVEAMHSCPLDKALQLLDDTRLYCILQAIGICHRDIKPQNILVNLETNVLKICDFGSAKRLVVGEPNIAYICSRYYRAPELIFGATDYNTQIDMWSIGCVIAEMVILEPIFPWRECLRLIALNYQDTWHSNSR